MSLRDFLPGARISPPYKYSVFAKTGISILMPSAALLICGVLQPWLEPTFEAPFIAAVAITAWLCGTPYAIAATLLSLPALHLLTVSPSPLDPGTARGLIKLLLFLGANAVVIALIDELFRSRERLTHAEKRHKNLSELIPFGGWIADPAGNMTNLSGSFLNTFAITLAECRGMKWLDLIEPQQRDQVRSEWLECMRSGYFWDYEYQMRARSGAVYSVLSRGVPIRDSSGRVQSWVGIHLDVTEMERSIEERVQQARDLARYNAEMEQLAYVSSHDLQEPLRIIASYLQLLARRYKGKLDADADTFIEFAVDGANRLKALLQDLMMLQQVGKSSRKNAPCNLHTIANIAVDRLKEMVDASGAVVVVEELPTVPGNQPELIQLFDNLFDNAMKYRRPDVPPEIHVNAEHTRFEWIIRIRDNGIGIEEEYLKRIFDIFQRLHPRSEHPGTGIGLAICKKIVEEHGGRIWAESVKNEGTTVCFTLRAE